MLHVYRVFGGKLVNATDASGVSLFEAPAIQRKLESEYQIGRFRNIILESCAPHLGL